MKKILSFLLSTVLLISCTIFSSSAEDTSKISYKLQEVLETKNVDEFVDVYVYTNYYGPDATEMPSWPNLEQARKELSEHYNNWFNTEIVPVVFKDIEYKEVFIESSIIIVSIKAGDVKKIAEYDIVTRISYFENTVQQPENKDLSESYEKLNTLCWSAVYDYGVSSTNRNSAYKYEPGVLVISLTNDSLEKTREVLDETSDFLDSYSIEQQAYTSEDFEDQYTKLKNALDTSVVSKGTLRSLINFCIEEKNDSSYYSEELWNDFSEKLNNAQGVYNDGEIVEDYKVTETFFELLHSHFNLCSSNTIFGDIDNDGNVTVLDATYLQMALAKEEELNSSQKLISRFDIMYATEIQRYIAKYVYSLEIENSTLDDFVEYTEYSDIHTQSFKFKSWKYNYFYVNYIADHNYPVYL